MEVKKTGDGIGKAHCDFAVQHIKQEPTSVSREASTITMKDLPLQCLECCFGFDSAESSRSHFLEVHDRVFEFQTNQNQGQDDVVEDGKETKPKPQPKCYFQYCNQSFSTIFEAQSHLLSAHGVIPKFLAPCSTCGLLYTKKRRLNRHELVTHNESFQNCTLCRIEFRSRMGVLEHIRVVHGPAAEEAQLTAAEKLKRSKPRAPAFYCFCGHKFKTKEALKSHERKGHKVPCKADGCTLTFKTGPKMLKHMEESHSNSQVAGRTKVRGRGRGRGRWSLNLPK